MIVYQIKNDMSNVCYILGDGASGRRMTEHITYTLPELIESKQMLRTHTDNNSCVLSCPACSQYFRKTSRKSDINYIPTKKLFVCLLIRVPSGTQMYFGLLAQFLQVSIIPSTRPHAPVRFGQESNEGSHSSHASP
jgi:hypothetical protein